MFLRQQIVLVVFFHVFVRSDDDASSSSEQFGENSLTNVPEYADLPQDVEFADLRNYGTFLNDTVVPSLDVRLGEHFVAKKMAEKMGKIKLGRQLLKKLTTSFLQSIVGAWKMDILFVTGQLDNASSMKVESLVPVADREDLLAYDVSFESLNFDLLLKISYKQKRMGSLFSILCKMYWVDSFCVIKTQRVYMNVKLEIENPRASGLIYVKAFKTDSKTLAWRGLLSILSWNRDQKQRIKSIVSQVLLDMHLETAKLQDDDLRIEASRVTSIIDMEPLKSFDWLARCMKSMLDSFFPNYILEKGAELTIKRVNRLLRHLRQDYFFY